MTDVIKIEKPIVSFKFLGSSDDANTVPKKPVLETVCETTERPAVLEGRTYKLRSPVYEAALYITINDIVLNCGTEYEQRRPFEIFINSKAMESFQWIVSLTRMISAVFRKGGDVTFIVEELKSVNDPRGGYWKRGKYIPSIVAEIAIVIEEHFINLGLLKSDAVEVGDTAVFPDTKTDKVLRTCPACNAPAIVRDSGCDKCLSCGWSKCS